MTTRRSLIVLLGAATTLLVAVGMIWRSAITRNRSVPDEPLRIAGNLYYVGATGVTVFLLTGPEGHVLIDGGYPETAPLIIASVARLGFDIEPVLPSRSHYLATGSARRAEHRDAS